MSSIRLCTLLILVYTVCVWGLQGHETLGNSQHALEVANTYLLSSVTPSPTPIPPVKEKRPNVVRRFFGWTIDQIIRPFRREPWVVCDLPPILFLSASKSQVTFCPATGSVRTTAACSPDRLVTLLVGGPDPDADGQFTFAWAVTAGTFRGEGRQVTWDLNGVPEGTYTATVEMNDGHQHFVSTSITVTVALCSGCEMPPPACPEVIVNCPNHLAAKELTFEAIVKGGDPEMQPAFTWSITAGKIVSGQGTSKLIVDTSDRGGRAITATVSLGGAHPACAVTQASCTIIH